MFSWKAVADYDHYLQKHLSAGGIVSDETGMILVSLLVRAALQDNRIRATCNQFSIPGESMAVIYAACIESLMPNPCIKSAKADWAPIMLAPTLFFLETGYLKKWLDLVAPSPEEEAIAKALVGVVQIIWKTHTEERGIAAFAIYPEGGGLEEKYLAKIHADYRQALAPALGKPSGSCVFTLLFLLLLWVIPLCALLRMK